MKNLFKILAIVCITQPLYAASTTHTSGTTGTSTVHPAHQSPRPEISFLLGASFVPNTIEDQTLGLLPYEVGPYADTFTDQTGGTAVTWGLDAKYRFKLHRPADKHFIVDAIGAGIGVYQITNFDQTGDVLQFGMPEFENYTYTLNLESTRVMADVDLDFHPIVKNLFPFIEVGLGAAATRVSYDSEPIPPINAPEFTLNDKTSWTFAYQVGAGLKYVVNSNLRLSLRYLYANMGNVDSSTTGSSTNLDKPLTVNMSTQNLFFGFTYAM